MGVFCAGFVAGFLFLGLVVAWVTSGPMRLTVWTLEKYDTFGEMWDVAGVYGSSIKAREAGNGIDESRTAVRCWEVKL